MILHKHLLSVLRLIMKNCDKTAVSYDSNKLENFRMFGRIKSTVVQLCQLQQRGGKDLLSSGSRCTKVARGCRNHPTRHEADAMTHTTCKTGENCTIALRKGAADVRDDMHRCQTAGSLHCYTANNCVGRIRICIRKVPSLPGAVCVCVLQIHNANISSVIVRLYIALQFIADQGKSRI